MKTYEITVVFKDLKTPHFHTTVNTLSEKRADEWARTYVRRSVSQDEIKHVLVKEVK